MNKPPEKFTSRNEVNIARPTEISRTLINLISVAIAIWLKANTYLRDGTRQNFPKNRLLSAEQAANRAEIRPDFLWGDGFNLTSHSQRKVPVS